MTQNAPQGAGGWSGWRWLGRALLYVVGVAVFASLLAWASSGNRWVVYGAVIGTLAAVRQWLAARNKTTGL